MLTSRVEGEAKPKLNLEYGNFSGKQIESILFTGWIKLKSSPYQLDAVSQPFQLRLSPNAQSKKAFRLDSKAIGFDRVELSRVTYADGTSWKPERQNCVYANAGSTEQARAW
jgi:hypothetical protein